MTKDLAPAPKFVRASSLAGIHKIAYYDWGPVSARQVIVCVHGLTRNGLDFNRLAAELAKRGCRVICIDMVGRGQSDWLSDPAHYHVPQYMADCMTVLAHAGVDGQVDWVGTSMGGLIGMNLAASASHPPIRRMVINDIGPFLPVLALQRIRDYVSRPWHFQDWTTAATHIQEVYQTFGNLSESDWDFIARISLKEASNGGYQCNYDVGIAENFKQMAVMDVDLWPVWQQVRSENLLLRGAESDLLNTETAQRMTERGPGKGPGAELVTFPGCGHPPPLLAPEQYMPVADWLTRPSAED